MTEGVEDRILFHMTSSRTSQKTIHRCPRCGEPISFRENPHRPFCSERCKLLDLHSWISEEYAIPATADQSDGNADNGQDLAERSVSHA